MKNWKISSLLGIVFLIGLFLRIPLIYHGMPYFYDEDEAHHFNRTVDMVKNRDPNPHYFHKPSLHFYLRAPVVYIAYLISKNRGEIRSVKEIRTHDPFGLAKYQFTASHPIIVKANRAFSVFLSLLILLFTYLISKEILRNDYLTLIPPLLVALSPPLIQYSAVIGVDTLMTLMCLIGIYLAILTSKAFCAKMLFITGLVCGLALSSKYNAAPIASLPLLLVIALRRFEMRFLLTSIVAPVLGFLGGSPYILVSFQDFLDQMGYEAWHYATEGHVGHTANPGLEQAMFYVSWLSHDGVGSVAVILGVIGAIILLSGRKTTSLIFLAFPILFFVMMSFQRANFTRNVLVLIPVIAITATRCIEWLADQLNYRTSRILVITACILSITLVPGSLALSYREQLLSEKVDSRNSLVEWLENRKLAGDFAVSGELQLPQNVYQKSGLVKVGLEGTNLLSLFLAGFSGVIAGPELNQIQIQNIPVEVLARFEGENEKQRVVRSPLIKVYEFNEKMLMDEISSDLNLLKSNPFSRLDLNALSNNESKSCYIDSKEQTTEDFCWIRTRISSIELPELPNLNQAGETRTVRVEIMTPWKDQVLGIRSGEFSWEFPFPEGSTGSWVAQNLTLPVGQTAFIAYIAQVHSPADNQLNSDNRRLGVAVKLR